MSDITHNLKRMYRFDLTQRLVGKLHREEAVPELVQLHRRGGAIADEERRRGARLSGANARCAEHHPFDLDVRTRPDQLQHGAAAADLDVVRVRAKKQHLEWRAGLGLRQPEDGVHDQRA